MITHKSIFRDYNDYWWSKPSCGSQGIRWLSPTFLVQIKGVVSKELLIRSEDVQVLHGFDSVENAEAYLKSEMFNSDVFVGLKPLWSADPEVGIFSVA